MNVNPRILFPYPSSDETPTPCSLSCGRNVRRTAGSGSDGSDRTESGHDDDVRPENENGRKVSVFKGQKCLVTILRIYLI